MGYIGSQPATNFETVRKQVSTTNSGTTITLDYSVSSVQDILVTVNAVVQSYDNYSVSGTTLTLGGTLNNDRVEILYVGRTFQTVTPAVGTVTNEMLSGNIANSKLANSSITLNGSSVSLGGSATVGGDNTPMWGAYMGSDQSASNNTITKGAFNTEFFDSDGAYDTSNYRFTVPSGKAGKYFITGFITFQGTGNDHGRSIYTWIYKNGGQLARPGYFLTGNYFENSQGNATSVSAIYDLAVGDYVELFGQKYNGAGILKSGTSMSYFGGYKLI